MFCRRLAFFLQIPDEVTVVPRRRAHQIVELSDQARIFLFNLAQIAQNECEKEIMENSSAAAVAVGGPSLGSVPEMQLATPSGDDASTASNTTSIFGFDARSYGLTWESLKYILCVLAPDTDAENPWLNPPLYKKLSGNNNTGAAAASSADALAENVGTVAGGEAALVASHMSVASNATKDAASVSSSSSQMMQASQGSDVGPTDTAMTTSGNNSGSVLLMTESQQQQQQCMVLSGLPHIGANLTFDSWLAQWHVLAVVDPALAQKLLFSLGYAEREELGTCVSSPPLGRPDAGTSGVASSNSAADKDAEGRIATTGGGIFDLLSSTLSLGGTSAALAAAHNKLVPRSTLKICVLGDNSVGKSSFVWNISGVPAPGIPDVEKGVKNAKSQDAVIVGGVCVPLRGMLRFTPNGGDRAVLLPDGRRLSDAEGGRRGTDSILGADSTLEDLQNVLYLCVSAIPRDQTASWLATHAESCDMALLMFDCGSEETFNTAVAMEQLLPDGMPRLFLGSKADLGDDEMAARATDSSSSSSSRSSSTRHNNHKLSAAVQSAAFYVQQHDLPPVMQTSIVSGDGIREVLGAVRDVALQPLGAVPVAQRPGRPAAAAFYPSLLKASCYAASLVGALYLLNAQFGVAKLVGGADLVRRARRWFRTTCGPLLGNIPYLAALLGVTPSAGSGGGGGSRVSAPLKA
jgi:hypothetical protein